MNDEQASRLTNFFFEAGFLQNLQRSGNAFLGSGNQTVASHIFRTVLIGYTLSAYYKADNLKVLLMCLFHDIEESRTGDLNYFQQGYVKSDDERAFKDVISGLLFQDDIALLIEEYSKLQSMEAKIAKDADSLELILYLKEQYDKGNEQALNWLIHSKKRLITDYAKHIAMEIEKTKYYEWWRSTREEWASSSKQW